MYYNNKKIPCFVIQAVFIFCGINNLFVLMTFNMLYRGAMFVCGLIKELYFKLFMYKLNLNIS